MYCAYCELPEINEREIVRNELARAFSSNRAIGPCHILIAPLRCVATWDEMTQDEQAAVLSLRKRLKPVLKEEYGAEGFNYAWNEGELAGQSVPHFHLHIIPRRRGDTGVTGYDPRQYLYRPEKWEDVSDEVLKRVAQNLRNSLS